MKNSVFFYRNEATLSKFFRCKSKFNNALNVYRKKLEFTPTLLNAKYPKLTISYAKANPIQIQNDFFLLGKTLYEFHTQLKRDNIQFIHFDNNPRNILWNGLQYIFIDFEEITAGIIEEDLIHFLLFWCENTTAVFEKKMHSFLKGYKHYSPKKCFKILPIVVNRFDTRRKKYCSTMYLSNPNTKKNRDLLIAYLKKEK